MKTDFDDFLDDLKKSGLNITENTQINLRIVPKSYTTNICVACQMEMGHTPDLNKLLLASMADRPAVDVICCLCDTSIYDVGRSIAVDFLQNIPKDL